MKFSMLTARVLRAEALWLIFAPFNGEANFKAALGRQESLRLQAGMALVGWKPTLRAF
jgi:hypothetical protein